MLRQASIAVLFLAEPLLATSSFGDEPETTAVATAEFTPAETAYIALAEEFHRRLEDYWKESADFYRERGDKITNEEAEAFEAGHEPSPEFLPKLLAFEREHSGQDVGLDALSEVVSYAARGGSQDWPAFQARREVLDRLPVYEDRDQATIVVRRLALGPYDPEVMDYLRRAADSAGATPAVRAAARLQWGERILGCRAARETIEKRIRDYKNGMPTNYQGELEFAVKYLATLPSVEELDENSDDAVAMLEELAASGDLLRRPAIRPIDPTGHLIRIDAEKTQSGTPYSKLADAVLFKERHLRTGQAAPDIEVKLLDGQPWKLADQRGRVAVIQFSFTGCSPCEAMYPGMRELADDYGDRVSMLTILRDETPDDGHAAAKNRKITWPIACDGRPGEFCTRWAVDSFPETYVVDRDGRIAAVGPRGDQLRWIVERLIGK